MVIKILKVLRIIVIVLLLLSIVAYAGLIGTRTVVTNKYLALQKEAIATTTSDYKMANIIVIRDDVNKHTMLKLVDSDSNPLSRTQKEIMSIFDDIKFYTEKTSELKQLVTD